MIDRTTFWLVTAGLGLGTYAIRFSFLGALGNRQLPRWALRALRYTGVAMLPALVAPAAVWPASTGGAISPLHLMVAGITLAVGALMRNTIAAIICGATALLLLPWLIG